MVERESVARVATKFCVSFLLVTLLYPPSSQADQDDCTSGAAIGHLQCLAPQVAELRIRLKQSYDRVLEKTPSSSNFDNRKTAQQLEKSQSAWEAYVKENCAYVGGLQGGSNAWVSVFATRCLVKEIELRIDFLEHLPSGG